MPTLEVRTKPLFQVEEDRAGNVGVLVHPTSPTSRDDVLRLRLKKAMGSVGG